MKLQRSKYSNTCFLTSFAMAFGVEQEILIESTGHRGNIRVFDAPEPFCFRGHHPQEMIDFGLMVGKAVIQIDRHAVAGYNDKLIPIELPADRFENHLERYHGVLCTLDHAMAWDGLHVYDPKGEIYEIGKVINDLISFFIVIPISN